MWLVDTGYASFSAFDELKGQSPFHRPRPEELLTENKKRKENKRDSGEGKKEGAFKSLCRGTVPNQKSSINFNKR